jgi:hypothetical protein
MYEVSVAIVFNVFLVMMRLTPDVMHYTSSYLMYDVSVEIVCNVFFGDDEANIN